MSQAVLRSARADDFRRYAGLEMPADWCADEWVCGWALERDGALVGYGFVTQDAYGRLWGWFSRREALSPFLMHRHARHLLGMLRRAGYGVVYTICDDSVPRAAAWLQRLGFEATEVEMEQGRVWQCALST